MKNETAFWGFLLTLISGIASFMSSLSYKEDPNMFIYGISMLFKLFTLFFMYLVISDIYTSHKIKKNTAEIKKVIFKGVVVAKDKKTNVRTGRDDVVSTSHEYKTSVRINNGNDDIIYFHSEDVYMQCAEADEVGVMIITYLDKYQNILKEDRKFMGSYKQYQDVKDQYIRNLGMGDAVVDVSNVPCNDYIIF